MYSLDEFIRENDKEDKVKKAICECIIDNMTNSIAIDILANDLQFQLYQFISFRDDITIDDGSNVKKDFTNAIKNILEEYLNN